ncbi:MAG: hypothetical protein ABH827_06230 [bacterium]
MLNFFTAFKYLTIAFWWLLLVEFSLFWAFGSTMINTMHEDAQVTNVAVFILSLIMGTISLILSASLLLFMRKRAGQIQPLLYIKTYLVRYIQIVLFFSVASLAILSILTVFGITKLPSIHWPGLFAFHIVQLITLFAWLDSNFTFKKIFGSIEKSINIFIYNLPLFTIVIIGMWASHKLVTSLIFGVPFADASSFAMLNNKTQSILEILDKQIPTINIILFKYISLIVEFFWISLIFIIYDRKKLIPYTDSFIK